MYTSVFIYMYISIDRYLNFNQKAGNAGNCNSNLCTVNSRLLELKDLEMIQCKRMFERTDNVYLEEKKTVVI